MGRIEKRALDDGPDESRPFLARGCVDVATVGGIDVGRATFEPGWRWSVDVKPLGNTASCEEPHTGYIASGRLIVALDSGQQLELEAGDAYHIPAGHDAWNAGAQPCVMIDVVGMKRTPGPH